MRLYVCTCAYQAYINLYVAGDPESGYEAMEVSHTRRTPRLTLILTHVTHISLVSCFVPKSRSPLGRVEQ